MQSDFIWFGFIIEVDTCTWVGHPSLGRWHRLSLDSERHLHQVFRFSSVWVFVPGPVLESIRKKLTYCYTARISLAGKALELNHVLLATMWYVASCWCSHVDSIK